MNITTIQLDKSLVEALREVREYPRQTYNDLIMQMLKIYKSSKKNNQYDKFIHTIQRSKMNELWDNNNDEDWDNV
ncbi:MAG: hypothetical protein ACMXYE_02530 [Candidatus Woesearchaeota archaeon]